MRYYDDTHQTAPQRDRIIVELRRHGISLRCLGKAVRMDSTDVLRALRRIDDQGRLLPRDDEPTPS